MGEVHCSLTVFFEEPFWVGVFERLENGRITASKVTFGAEPNLTTLRKMNSDFLRLRYPIKTAILEFIGTGNRKMLIA